MRNEYDKFSCGASCPAVGSQECEVNVPVSVRAHANVGDVRTQCLGPCVIMPGYGRGGRSPSNPIGEFVISQRMKVEVPVSFGTDTEIGAPDVNFDCMAGKSGMYNGMYGDLHGDRCPCEDGYQNERYPYNGDCGCKY